MDGPFSRLSYLLGQKAVETLSEKTVAVFGIGGVGGYVVEALCRSGIGHLVLIDNDEVMLSNLNRQIIATMDAVGQKKVEVAKRRILSINPECLVDIHPIFYRPEDGEKWDFSSYDYVVDAIDTVSAKLDIIVRCKTSNIPIISSMGAGNKMNPAMMRVADLSKTEMDPLARVMRRELGIRGIKHLKVVYSKEKPLTPKGTCSEGPEKRRNIPGSNAFVPSAAGLLIASEVVKDLIGYIEP